MSKEEAFAVLTSFRYVVNRNNEDLSWWPSVEEYEEAVRVLERAFFNEHQYKLFTEENRRYIAKVED